MKPKAAKLDLARALATMRAMTLAETARERSKRAMKMVTIAFVEGKGAEITYSPDGWQVKERHVPDMVDAKQGESVDQYVERKLIQMTAIIVDLFGPLPDEIEITFCEH